jgi:hypothetical protein
MTTSRVPARSNLKKMTTLSNGRKILLFLIFFLFSHSFFSRDRTWAAYKILLYLAPQLKNVLDDPEPTSLNTFLSQVSFSRQSSFLLPFK